MEQANSPFTCWIDNAHGRKQGAEETVGRIAHRIRTARTQEQFRKAAFDLAFFTQFTKATHPSGLTPLEYGYLATWCFDNQIDIAPKFVKPEWGQGDRLATPASDDI